MNRQDIIFVQTDPAFYIVLEYLREIRDRLQITHLQTASIEDIESNNESDDQNLVFGGPYGFARTASSVARMCMLSATNIPPGFWPAIGHHSYNRNNAKMNREVLREGCFVLANDQHDARSYCSKYDQLYPHFIIQHEMKSVTMDTQITLPAMMLIVRGDHLGQVTEIIEITTTFNATRRKENVFNSRVHVICMVRSVKKGGNIKEGQFAKMLKEMLKHEYSIKNSYVEEIKKCTAEKDLEGLPNALDHLEIVDVGEKERKKEELKKKTKVGDKEKK